MEGGEKAEKQPSFLTVSKREVFELTQAILID